MRWQSKRPNEVRKYAHDWTPYLADGDSVASKTVTASGVTKDSDTLTGNIVTVILSAGTSGTTGVVTMTITTAGGEIETEEFTIAITTLGEPISVAEAKEECQVASSDTTYDGWFERNIPAARAYVENRSDHILVQRAILEYRDSFGTEIKLYHRPITEITSVTYIDPTGASTPFTDFLESLNRWPARIYPGSSSDGFPAALDNSEIVIEYVAGYAPGEEPEELMRAIRMLIATWFANRESLQDGLSEVPHGVDALCDQKRGALV